MRIAFFSTQSYDREFFDRAATGTGHELCYFEPRLTPDTAVLAADFPAVCAFVNDVLDAVVLQRLAKGGTRLVLMRCAGVNNVDLEAAGSLGMQVARVPAYSPFAVAEHAVALILSLNRKLHKAYNRVREGNFSLERLLGFDLNGQTVGVIGTGRIGVVVTRILHGFGCRLLLHDVQPNPDCTPFGEYVPLARLLAESDIVSLHCPLVPQTYHLIGREAIGQMKPGVMLINTSRGALIDTQAVIDGLKSGRIGYLGLDVYEEEADLFFRDLSGAVIQDDVFARLLTFPNVLITGHQAFFTREALSEIARVTLANAAAAERGERSTT